MMDVAEPPVGPFLISYAHESPEHETQVRRLAELLIEQGLAVHLDQFAAEERQNWGWWTIDELAAAERVLVVVSRAYRRRFDREDGGAPGSGVHFESYLITDEVFGNPAAALRKFVPVLLPGITPDQIPTVLLPNSGTHYKVPELTTAGIEHLARLLRGQLAVPGRPVPETSSKEPVAAVHLAVAGGSPALADEMVRVLIGSGADVAGVEFDAEAIPGGGVATGSAQQMATLLSATARAIRGLLLYSPPGHPRAVARLGAHLAATADQTVAVATRLSLNDAAARLHDVPGADVVLIASEPFFAAVEGAPELYPRATSYGPPTDVGGGLRCRFAVAGLARAPEPPPVAPPTRDAAGTGHAAEDRHVAHVVVGVNRGVVNTGTIGTLNYSERDLALTIVKNYGGTR